MKRFKFLLNSSFGKIALLLFTFVFGVVSIFLWFEVSKPRITLCQLAKNPEWYDGKTITVETDARSYNGSIVLTESNCDPSYDTHTSILSVEGYKLTSKEQIFFQESKTEIRRARILVTGRFDAHTRTNCWTPKWAIRAANVQIKSPISVETIELPKEIESVAVEGFIVC